MKPPLSREKPLLILGRGKTGLAACHAAQDLGFQVVSADEHFSEESAASARELQRKKIAALFARQESLPLQHFCGVVVSPGIPLSPRFCKNAAAASCPILSEIEFGLRHFFHPRIIAVTGTNGKTTTSQLIAHLLRGVQPLTLCGNIGTPLLEALPKLPPRELVVLEVSSFQLEQTASLHPLVAAFLNFAEDHLDRHPNREDYFAKKAKLFQNQNEGDTAVLYARSPEILSLSSKLPSRCLFFSIQDHGREGAFLQNETIVFREKGRVRKIGAVAKLPSTAPPFVENVLAALACAHSTLSHAEASVAQLFPQLATFQIAPHRLQKVATVRGIHFVDDSKATNPHAVGFALESVQAPVILILGGRDKGLSFAPLLSLFQKKVRAFILIGEAQEKIERELLPLTLPRTRASTMREAVQAAFERAKRGDTVLLSPGCTSFDWYSSYGERGDAFQKEVQALAEN